MLYAWRSADDPRFPFAAAAYAIDRMAGAFAGGRWVFWLVSTPPQDDEWSMLLGAARPVHILTPTATVRRIVNVTALLSVEAQQQARSGN